MGPGRRLRDARKVMNLDQADIAANLNLSLTVVNALERDDYEDMPPPVFVRGYLRAYAVLVKQPEDEICAMFDALGGHDAEDDPFRPVTLQDEKMPSESAKWGKGVVIVLLLALLGFAAWYLAPQWQDQIGAWSSAAQEDVSVAEPQPVAESAMSRKVRPWREEVGDTAESGGQAVSESVSPASSFAASSPEVINSEPEAAVDAVSRVADAAESAVESRQPGVATAEAGVEAGVEAAQAVVESTQDTVTQAALQPVPEPTKSVVTLPDTAPDVAESAADTVSAAAQGSSEGPADAGLATLSLSFSDSCWTSISDANGKRMVYGVMKAGMQRVVSGVLPFKVILGQSDAVKVRLNGKSFDHQQFSRGKIARFSIGEGDV